MDERQILIDLSEYITDRLEEIKTDLTNVKESITDVESITDSNLRELVLKGKILDAEQEIFGEIADFISGRIEL